jgi:DNA recombination protein RmuC
VTLDAHLALGLVLGFVAGLVVGLLLAGSRRRVARALLAQADAQRQGETEALLDGVKHAFADISQDLVRRSADDLVRLAQTQLAGERRLQGQQLASERAEYEARIGTVIQQLERMQGLIRELERDRAAKFGQLAGELKAAGDRAQALAATTHKLAQALASPKRRGQWGERMAEDLLRLSGLVEKINYLREAPIEGGTRRPDFTLLLPEGRLLHMDVKFPLDNYLRSLEAEGAEAQTRLRTAFLRDVRARIAEVSGRDYVAPARGTLDFALLFLPNEQLFGAIVELEPGLLDEALKKRVVLVSPTTLFAVLAIVREMVATFHASRASREILELLSAFRTAWADYQAQQQRLGQRLEEALREHNTLVGTRRQRLDLLLGKVDGLIGRDVPAASPGETPP